MENKITTIYEKFRRPILRFLSYRVRDEHIAQDLLHEVFIKAVRSFDTLKDEEKIQNWLYAVASNTLKDYYRKAKIEVTDKVDLESEPMDEAVINELQCCLFDFLETLPQPQSEILRSVYFDEMSLVEFAKQKDKNLSTVKSHARRAKKAFKGLFEECCRFQTNRRGEIIDFVNNKTKQDIIEPMKIKRDQNER